MTLGFAGLHQMLLPFLDRLDGLPPPQRDALRKLLGIEGGGSGGGCTVRWPPPSILSWMRTAGRGTAPQRPLVPTKRRRRT